MKLFNVYHDDMKDEKTKRNYQMKKRAESSVKTALDIYMVKAKTGNLPKKLPPKTQKDIYTGKDMLYEITVDGFTLTCQGPDTKKDKIKDTYKFKVK